MRDNRLGAAYAKAKTLVGVREISGDEDNPIIVDLFRQVGHSWVHSDETAWCAAFTGGMLESQGIRSTRKLNARSYLDWGDTISLDQAQAGDLVIFWRVKEHGWQGHVGFYVSHGKTYINVLGGNQSDMVKVSQYKRSQLLGVRTLLVSDPPQPTNTPWGSIFSAIMRIFKR